MLVKVHASSINPAEWYQVMGPIFARVANGLRKPKQPKVGGDVAGRVEAVGSGVSGLQPGDAWSIAEADPGYDADLWLCTGTSIEAVTTPVPSSWVGRDRVNVVAMPTEDGATVKWIGAPALEADGCA